MRLPNSPSTTVANMRSRYVKIETTFNAFFNGKYVLKPTEVNLSRPTLIITYSKPNNNMLLKILPFGNSGSLIQNPNFFGVLEFVT